MSAQSATAYVQATGTVGTTGNVLNTTNHTGLTAAPADAFTFTSAAPKSLTGADITAAGRYAQQMVYQINVAAGAAGAATGQETLTWKYDDTSA